MKKIMKAFAAIAALAMVSSGFVACSDDEEEDTSPSLTIKTESALTAAAGEAFSVNATITLKNDSFSGDIPQGAVLNGYIDDWFVTDKYDFADEPFIEATEAASEGAKTLKINISGYAADVTSTKSGTLRFSLAADAVKSGKVLKSNAIKYQFTVAGGNGGAATATISFNANDAEPSVALTNTSDSSIFSNVQDSFGAYEIGSDFTIFTANAAAYSSAKFSVSNASNTKLSNYTVGTDNKVTMKGWLETATSSDETNGITISDEGAVIAYTTYTFTLAQAATVSAASVAFNGQSGNVYGQISILDSSSTVKATATGTVASKEDNDASIASVDLAAGTYTVKLAWITSGAGKTYKKWNCGIEKFTLTASAN